MTIDKLKLHYKYAKYTYNDKYTPEMISLRDEVKAFVESIEDNFIKKIIYYRYVMGKSWFGIAKMFKYGTPDCYRKMSERYIKKALKG